MATLFTKIINGDIPGRFVWRDDEVVAFLTIEPAADGHVLVVPIEEIDHWIDLPADLNAKVWAVSQTIGQVLQAVFQPAKVGVLVVGEEVPHAHVHLIPFTGLGELNLANVDRSPDPDHLDQVMNRIRDGLRAAGHTDVVPA